MENKTEENESRLITGDFKCTTAKMDRDCVKKAKRLYRCRSIFALSKLIVENIVMDL